MVVANVVVAIASAVVAAADDEQELDVLSAFYADGLLFILNSQLL